MYFFYVSSGSGSETSRHSNKRYDRHHRHRSTRSPPSSSTARDAAVIKKQKALWDTIQASRNLDTQLASTNSKNAEKRRAHKAHRLAFLQGETAGSAAKARQSPSPVRPSFSRKHVRPEGRSKRKSPRSSHRRGSPNDYVYSSLPDESGFSSNTGRKSLIDKRPRRSLMVHSSDDSSSAPARRSPVVDFHDSSPSDDVSSVYSRHISSNEEVLSDFHPPISPPSDSLAGLTQSAPTPPVHDQATTSSIPTTPVVVKSANPEEDEEVWIPGASSSFVSLVKKINEIHNNPSDDSVSQFPSLLCDDGARKPSIHRLPPSVYIKARKEYLRQSLLHDSRSEPTSKLFPKPPATLERVAELGDKLEQKSMQDGSGFKLGVVRGLPRPHEVWHDCLHDKFKRVKRGSQDKVPDKTHSSMIKFLPKHAKAIELATIWSLKSSNYIDNFLFLSKRISTEQSELAVLLQDWAKTVNPPADVTSGFVSLITQFEDQKNCISELKDLFIYIVNNLVYLNTMVELSRRDDLQTHISYLVSPRTRRAMRHSEFDPELCFSKENCEKAREEYLEGVKAFPNRGNKRPYSSYNDNQQDASSSKYSRSSYGGGPRRRQGQYRQDNRKQGGKNHYQPKSYQHQNQNQSRNNQNNQNNKKKD